MRRLDAKIYALALFDVLSSTQADKAENVVENFLRILRRRRHLHLVSKVLKEVENKIAEQKEKDALHVFAGEDINKKALEIIKEKLKTPAQVELVFNITPQIKGGVKARYKDTVLDATVGALFAKWQKQLVEI